MSFTLEPRRPTAYWIVSLTDIREAANRQRVVAHEIAADFLRGQDEKSDPIHALANAVMMETGDSIDAGTLGGSFNPSVAHRLMVGKDGKNGVYLYASADVQG